jgi:tRNA threonylcarbamoyladenosine biosynthesis protein TsaE
MLIPTAEAQEACAEALAQVLIQAPKLPLVIFLEGDLGAGKTTFARGLLRSLGYQGRVVSPSYTLVEIYQTRALQVAHLDLYRLGDPEELEYLGLADLLREDVVMLVEWPERGQGLLPAADMRIHLDYLEDGAGRSLEFKAMTEAGEGLARGWREAGAVT